MRLRAPRRVAAFGAMILLLVACGDSYLSTTAVQTSLLPEDSDNRGDARVRRPLQQVYDTIEGSSGAVSILEGVGILDDPGLAGGPATTRMYFVGKRDSATDAVFVTDTMQVLDDTDGGQRFGSPASITYVNTDYVSPPVGEMTTDRQSLLFSTSRSSPAVASYDYLRIWEWITTDDVGTQLQATNVLGVSTDPRDMPDAGGFDYDLGGFSLSLRRQGGTTSFRRATAIVEADFETGMVDVYLTHEDTNIDAVVVTGMEIQGNSFSGGVVRLIDGGVDVTAARVGGLNGVDAAGLFFGPVVDGAPMEVGGAITIQGLTASYQIFFVAE